MSVHFPLQDIRQNFQGNWELEQITESITVPISGDYIVRLKEIPDNGEIESAPIISGLARVNTYNPSDGQFSVKYSTGDVKFNSAQSGNLYNITYYGKGSLIEADDINYLYNRAIDNGTNDGELLYWNTNLEKWTSIDSSKLKWNGNDLETQTIKFNTSYTPSVHSQGLLHWNSEDETLEIDLTDSVKLQIGQELYVRVKNTTGSSILNGQVVRPIGSTGDNPLIDLAIANSYSTSRPVGVATEDIPHNQNGFVTIFGVVRDINTSSFNEGDLLYLSSTIAGSMTNIKPSYPNVAHRIGVVIRKHATVGIIVVDSDIEGDIFTHGSVLFANGNGEPGEDNSNLFWDNDNNYLGIGTNSPSAELDVRGVSRFGSKDSYTQFSEDGTLTMSNSATVWDDQQVNIGSVGKGSSFPTDTLYKGSQILAFAADQDNQIYFDCQLSHKYKYNSNIEFHLHVTVPNNNTGTIIWEFTYSWAKIGEVFPDPTTITKTITLESNSQDKHLLHEISDTIDGSGKDGLSSILLCSLTRKGTTDTYASSVYLLALDFHIEMDTIGSKEEYIK